MNTNTNYNEPIATVANILAASGIPFSYNRIFEGGQIRFPWCKGDVACHSGTYGSGYGAVETFEFPWDDGDVSCLMPASAAWRIIRYYQDGETVGATPFHPYSEE